MQGTAKALKLWTVRRLLKITMRTKRDDVKGSLKEDDENSEDVSIMENDPRTY